MLRHKLIWVLCFVLMASAFVGVGQASSKVTWPVNGHDYQAIPITTSITWQEARAAAEAMGGYLVTITSQAEQDFIVANFPEVLSGRWWIGAYQTPPVPETDPAADWHWVTGEPWGYTNWYPGEPNNDSGGYENDGMLWHNGTWNDCVGTCSSVGYIVEWDGTVPPTTTHVVINVKPASWPNAANLRGTVPVAILTTRAGEYGTTADFDATQVDWATVRFGPVAVLDAGGGGVEIHGTGHIEDSYEPDDVTMDGDLDMVLHFNAEASEIPPGTSTVCVRGMTYSGVAFEGCDTIVVHP